MPTEEKTKKVTTKKTVKKTETEKAIKTVKKEAVKKPVKKAKNTEKVEVKKADVKVEEGAKVQTEVKPEKKQVTQPKEQPKKKVATYFAVGRRKTATAFAKLIADPQKKEKTFTVNGRNVEAYFSLPQQKKAYLEPLRTTNTINRFDVAVRVVGSGQTGQLGAVIHAVSRALIKVDPERFRIILRKRGFTTRDPRAKERKKVGLMGARHVKQSPRR